MNSTQEPVLPNPLTSLAWLPPDVADQLEASRYLYCAVLGAWIWELFVSLPGEIRMVRKCSISVSDIAYMLARMSSAGYIVGCFIFQLGRVGDCQKLETAVGWLGAFAVPFNCLLFFFRVKAVFNDSKLVIIFFGILWLATWGCCMTAPFSLVAGHIGTTRNCLDVEVKSFASAGFIAAAVNDALVFIAISTKLVANSFADTWSDRMVTFFRGRGIGNVSRILLQTGQLYYMLTAGMNIVSMVVILTPSVPPVVRAMFTVPNIALQNTLACRVYRLLKLGLINDGVKLSSNTQGRSDTYVLPFYKRKIATDQSGTLASGQSANSESTTPFDVTRNTKSVPVHVEISRDIEVGEPGMDGWKAGSLSRG